MHKQLMITVGDVANQSDITADNLKDKWLSDFTLLENVERIQHIPLSVCVYFSLNIAMSVGWQTFRFICDQMKCCFG